MMQNCEMHQRPVSLIGFANLLKNELDIDSSTTDANEVIVQSSIQLGIMNESDSMIDRANKCFDQLFAFSNNDESTQEFVHFSYSLFSEAELINSHWQAGVSGTGTEAFLSNPWTFSAGHRFVTERDGCSGSWALSQRIHPLTGVPAVKLRLDWEGNKNVNWAEFTMNHPSQKELESGDRKEASPLFSCTGASHRYMRSWSLRRIITEGFPISSSRNNLSGRSNEGSSSMAPVAAVGTVLLSSDFIAHFTKYFPPCLGTVGWDWVARIGFVLGLLAVLLFILYAFIHDGQ